MVGLQASVQAVAPKKDFVTCLRAFRVFVAEQETPEDSQGFPFLFFSPCTKDSVSLSKGPSSPFQLQARKNRSA